MENAVIPCDDPRVNKRWRMMTNGARLGLGLAVWLAGGVVTGFGAGVVAAPAWAELPVRDFTFKRVRVGDALSGRRITVQIDPVEQALLLAARPSVTPLPDAGLPAARDRPLGPVPSRSALYDWYWDKVPAGIDQADGRFELALAALSQGPQGAIVAAPRLQDMQGIADDWGIAVLRATVGTRVSPALALAVIATESAGAVDATSSAGAQGLMQLIPATAERFGVADAFDPVENISGGVAYLDWLMERFGQDPVMVLAAYNAGEGAVTANRGVPPYAETRDYVAKVLAAWQVAQGVCQTPPELVSDPCVFKRRVEPKG